MKTRGLSRRSLTFGVLVGAALVAGSTPAQAAEELKIGTLAPASSPWGQVFKTWAEAVSKKSAGTVTLQFFYNGGQGDEASMVAKLKAGKLDGVAVTAVGLGKIYKPILALQMPGLFTTWAKLDAARNAMKGEFTKGVTDAGFTMLGWGDVGAVRFLSKGIALKSPTDLQGQKPYLWRDDDSQSTLYHVIGGLTPVPLNVPEVLPQLNTTAINAVLSPALAAEQLQWSSRLDTINSDVSFMAIGALVMASKRLAALPEPSRTIVLDTGRIAASALGARIRAEDDAAFARLKGKMTVITHSADEQARWNATYKQTRARLAQGVFSADLVQKLEALAR